MNDFVTKKAFDDENMVRWYVAIAEGDGSNYFSKKQIVKVHKCNEDDWKTFFPPKKDIKERIDQLKKEGTMFCLN